MKMNENVFLVVSMPMVGILDDPQSLFNELALRPYQDALVMRVKDMNEANFLAFQEYGINFWGYNQDANARPMALPVSGKFLLSPLARNEETSREGFAASSNCLVTQPQDFFGVWGVSAMNGFGAGFVLSDLVHAMCDTRLVYPVARWTPSSDSSYTWARADYVRRFYSRYVGTSISPRIPSPGQMPIGKMFLDSEYESHEENRQENDILSKFLSYGLLS